MAAADWATYRQTLQTAAQRSKDLRVARDVVRADIETALKGVPGLYGPTSGSITNDDAVIARLAQMLLVTVEGHIATAINPPEPMPGDPAAPPVGPTASPTKPVASAEGTDEDGANE